MDTSTVTGQESSHVWLCDGCGDVFVLRDFYLYKDSKIELITKEGVPPLRVTQPTLPWEKVGSGFGVVVGGFSGLVFGTQKQNLCVRLGVTHDNPVGNSWGKVLCEVAEVAVGYSFVVRKTSRGEMFCVNMSRYDLMGTKSLLALKWQVVPPCPKEYWENDENSGPIYMSLDEADNFFLIDCRGNVCVYTLKSTNVAWTKVCNAPVAHKHWSVFNWITRAIWREDENQKCTLLHPSAGQRSIWCLDSESLRLWQLVLSTGAEGKTVKANWSEFELPTDREYVSICADKCKVGDFLLAVKSREGCHTFFYYSLIINSKTKVNVTPVHLASPSSWCQTLSICRTSVDSVPSYEPSLSLRSETNESLAEFQPRPSQSFTQFESGPNESLTKFLPGPNQSSAPLYNNRTSSQAKEAEKLYPSLSEEDTDHSVCCETGDCYFCRKAASQPTLSHVLNNSEPSSRKRGRPAAEPEDDLGFIPKRSRYISHALDGIDVVHDSLLDYSIEQLPKPSQLVLPLTLKQLEAKFNFSLEMEYQVIAGTYNYFNIQ